MAKTILLRDPVHGDIELTTAQVAVLDTPQMQRLRGVKQLGTAYLVYPGCTHSRFEHSLGTMAAANRIISSLRQAGYAISSADAELVGIAALLHDVAHMPFGHTLEDERSLLPRHDSAEYLVPVLSAGELGAVLQKLGIMNEIIQLLTSADDWRAQVVSGSIDADLLDYLRRDSYYAGISQDYDDRIYQYFCLAEGKLALRLTKRGMDRPDAYSEVLHLLRMRYFLTERVYLHHAKMAAGVMISRAVELCLQNHVPVPFLRSLTDEGLLLWLAGRWSEPVNTDAALLAENVLARRLYKRAYCLSGQALPAPERASLSALLHGNAGARERLAANIAARAGVPENAVIVHCTGDLPFRELSIPAYTRHGLHMLNSPPDGVAPYPDISALEAAYRNLWRLWVFTPESTRHVVADAAGAEFGYANEFLR